MEVVMSDDHLAEEKGMLNVVPELDAERDGPPLAPLADEALAQRPQTDQHHQRVAVVQRFRADQPRIKKAEDAARLGPRPVQHVNLPGLDQVLRPVPQDDNHEKLESTFVPAAVQLVGKGERTVGEFNVTNGSGCSHGASVSGVRRFTNANANITLARDIENSRFILKTRDQRRTPPAITQKLF